MTTGSMFHFSGFAAAMASRATRLETLSHLWKARQHLNPRVLPWSWCELDRIAKGCADCFTHPLYGEIADEDTLLVLKSTHRFLLCGSPLSYSAIERLLITSVP